MRYSMDNRPLPFAVDWQGKVTTHNHNNTNNIMTIKLVLNEPIGGKKSFKISLNDDYNPKGKYANTWSVVQYPEEGFWSLCYHSENTPLIEFEFKMHEYGPTLEPRHGLIWERDAIDKDFTFKVEQQ